MDRFSTCLVYVLLVALFSSVKLVVVRGDCEYLKAEGGGCPDLKACAETCAPCYRKLGQIMATCVNNECRCYFYRAPCPPRGSGPPCPKPPTTTTTTSTAFLSPDNNHEIRASNH